MSIADEIRELQMFLDGSDPFLMDFLHNKTIEQLSEQLTKLQQEREVIAASGNRSWLSRHESTIEVVQAVFRLKCIAENDSERSIVIG